MATLNPTLKDHMMVRRKCIALSNYVKVLSERVSKLEENLLTLTSHCVNLQKQQLSLVEVSNHNGHITSTEPEGDLVQSLDQEEHLEIVREPISPCGLPLEGDWLSGGLKPIAYTGQVHAD